MIYLEDFSSYEIEKKHMSEKMANLSHTHYTSLAFLTYRALEEAPTLRDTIIAISAAKQLLNLIEQKGK